MSRKAPTIPTLTTAEVSAWSPSKINTALDRLEKLSSALTDEFIAAGRGYEKPSETETLSDPLAERYKRIQRAQSMLRIEIALRYGPGAPRRLPRGFGPRKEYT